MINKIIRYLREAYLLGHYPSVWKLSFKRNKFCAYYGFLGDQNFGDELVYQATKLVFDDYVLIPIKRRMPILIYLLSKIGIIRFSGHILGGGTLGFSNDRKQVAVVGDVPLESTNLLQTRFFQFTGGILTVGTGAGLLGAYNQNGSNREIPVGSYPQ